MIRAIVKTCLLIHVPALALALACGYTIHDDHSSEGCPPGDPGCPCVDDQDCESAYACEDGTCQPGAGDSTTTVVTTVVTTAATTSATTVAGTGGDTSTGPAETGVEGSTGCEFICETDAFYGDELCDVFAQDCPEGQKCVIYDQDGDGAWDSSKCADITGDSQHGDPCTAVGGASGIDDCAKGVMCWNLNEDGEGTCIAMCSGTPENPMCEPPGTSCNGGRTIWLCLPGCNPILQDCSGSEVCIGDPNSDGFVCVLDASGGMAPEGTPCDFANVCNPGNMCVNPDFYPNPDCQGSLGCCAPFCDLDDANACEGLSVEGVTCVAYHEPGSAPPGLENVGVCGVGA